MIAVDIGNTSVEFVWFKESKITKALKLPTSKISRKHIQKILSSYSKENILICSVVPKVTALFKKLGKRVSVVGEDIIVPMRCLYSKKAVGMDRLVAAYAVKVFFPRVRLVLDFGTAITLDFLSKEGDYWGGIILPGIGSTIRVLSQCALLPSRIKIAKTKVLIPKTTKESINTGLQEGFSLMINSLIKKYKKKLRISSREKIVITGGEASVIRPKLDFPYYYEPFLVAKGLWSLGNRSLRTPYRK